MYQAGEVLIKSLHRPSLYLRGSYGMMHTISKKKDRAGFGAEEK